MTTQQIEDLGAVRLADTVDYVSGISRLNDFGGTWDNFAIRGFSSTDMGFLVNGSPVRAATIRAAIRPPSNASNSSRAGRRALRQQRTGRHHQHRHQETAIHAQEQRRTQCRHRRPAPCHGRQHRPLGQNLAYRLIAMTEEGDSRSSLLHNRRSLVAPSLAWVIDKDTLLNYEAEFLQASTPLDRGLINVRGVLGTLPRDRVLNEPSDGNMAMRSNTPADAGAHAVRAVARQARCQLQGKQLRRLLHRSGTLQSAGRRQSHAQPHPYLAPAALRATPPSRRSCRATSTPVPSVTPC
jgi:iron complex outermembrane receptor protein